VVRVAENGLIAEEGVVGVCRFRGCLHGFSCSAALLSGRARRAPGNELCTSVAIAQGMDHALQLLNDLGLGRACIGQQDRVALEAVGEQGVQCGRVPYR
jgi:hypothetical protein